MIFNNSVWRGKVWRFYQVSKKWNAPEDILQKLYSRIDSLNYGEIDADLYDVARLTARLANTADLARYHSEPKLSQLAERRWCLEVGSEL